MKAKPYVDGVNIIVEDNAVFHHHYCFADLRPSESGTVDVILDYLDFDNTRLLDDTIAHFARWFPSLQVEYFRKEGLYIENDSIPKTYYVMRVYYTLDSSAAEFIHCLNHIRFLCSEFVNNSKLKLSKEIRHINTIEDYKDLLSYIFLQMPAYTGHVPFSMWVGNSYGKSGGPKVGRMFGKTFYKFCDHVYSKHNWIKYTGHKYDLPISLWFVTHGFAAGFNPAEFRVFWDREFD